MGSNGNAHEKDAAGTRIPGSLYKVEVKRLPAGKFALQLKRGGAVVGEKVSDNRVEMRSLVKRLLVEQGIAMPDVRLTPVAEALLTTLSQLDRKKPPGEFVASAVTEVFQAGAGEGGPGQRKKILLFGLDQAGKTSINQRVFAALNPCTISPTPTLGVEFEQFQTPNVNLVIWDFGGQKTFRDQYRSETMVPRIFSDVGTLIYVFDSADPARFEEALDYFEWVWINLEQANYRGAVHVFIHKIDKIVEKASVREFLEERMGGNARRVQFHYTSIYQESLYIAWSKIMIELFPKARVLSAILQSLKAQQGFGDSVVMLRRTGLICASSGTEELDEVLLEFCCTLLNTVERVTNNLFSAEVTRVVVDSAKGGLAIVEIDRNTMLAMLLAGEKEVARETLTARLEALLPKIVDQLRHALNN